ncbi:HTH_Tnp_Tc3_2 domain-containing protein [Trichonephila clavipes]|nr:HTH_Tnp_Tc3_2 domain-containing protein [Trichonephila clavipes]
MRKLGCCDNCIRRAYCGYSELVVGIASMGKLPDLDVFDHGQMVGARRLGHSVSEIVKLLGISRLTVSTVYQEYMDGAQKTSNRENRKGQLVWIVKLHRRPMRVPLLNACQQAARLAWTREHGDWSVEDWKRVTWSDDTRIRLLNADGRLKIWRQAHEAMDLACQFGIVQGHCDSIIVWDVFSGHCLGCLCVYQPPSGQLGTNSYCVITSICL